MRTLATLVALIPLVACDDGGNNVDCDAMAVASVQVEVVDDQGDPVPDATGSFTTQAGLSGDCESLSGELVCGWEVGGTMDITIRADGFVDAEEQVDIEEGECHVVTEFLTVALVPSDEH